MLNVEKKIKLLSIGRFVEKYPFKDNIQDYNTWNSMGAYFDEIYIIVQSPDDKNYKERIDNLNIYWIANKKNIVSSRIYFAKTSYKLSSQLIETRKIDVINVSEPVVSGPIAVKLKRDYRLPLVTQIQGQLLTLPRGTFSGMKQLYIEKVTLLVSRCSDAIRAVSKDIGESLIIRGVSRDKISIVPSRCDTEKFDPTKYLEDRNKIREELGIRESDFVAVFTGRVVKYRDIETDIRAIRVLKDRNVRISFVVVGDGDNLDNIKKLTNELRLNDRVFFVGRVTYDDIPRYLSVGDVFISTPTNEAIARGVLEAMSMKLPTIATAVGGNKEVISDGKDGMLVSVGKASQVADCLLQLYNNKSRRLEMGKNARNRILENYEQKKMIEKFAEVHYKCIWKT